MLGDGHLRSDWYWNGQILWVPSRAKSYRVFGDLLLREKGPRLLWSFLTCLDFDLPPRKVHPRLFRFYTIHLILLFL